MQTFDNSNTFAAFPSKDGTQLSGPLYFESERQFRLVVTVGAAGGAHAAEVFRADKDGQPTGVAVATGTLRVVKRNNPDAPTVVLSLSGKKVNLRYAGWEKEGPSGYYMQGRVDSVELRARPAL